MKANLILLAVLVAVFVAWVAIPPLTATPNSNTPSYSVSEALQGIQEAVSSLATASTTKEKEVNSVATEGYCEYIETAEDSNQVVLIVPAGRQFVLRKLYVRHREKAIWDYWHLSVDGDVLIDGGIVYELSDSPRHGAHDFPDNCVVIDAGKTLRAVNEMSEDGTYTLKTTIIGYFRDTR